MKPLPKCGPCCVNGQDAPLCVVGLDPDRRGGGVLHWAWDMDEASRAADAYREHGYHDVKVMNALADRTKQKVHEIVFGILKDPE
jgi:hypothetical protein